MSFGKARQFPLNSLHGALDSIYLLVLVNRLQGQGSIFSSQGEPLPLYWGFGARYLAS